MKTGVTIASELALTVCLAVAGCSVLAPQPDPSRFFTLAPMAQAPAAAPAQPGFTYGLGPIKLPAYLDRNEIPTRVSPTEIIYSPAERWAEPLQASVTRVLMQNLAALLNTDKITVYPWIGATAVDYQIEIEVLHF